MKNPFRRRADKGGKKSSTASPSTTSKKATVNGNARGAGHRAEQAKEDHGTPSQPSPQRSAPQPKSTAVSAAPAPPPPPATQLPTAGFEERTSLDVTGSTATRSVPSSATPDGLSALASMRAAEATEKTHTLPKGIPDAFSDVDPLSTSKKTAKPAAGAETEAGQNEAVGLSEDRSSSHQENGEPPRAEPHSKAEEDSEPLSKDDRAPGVGNTQGDGDASDGDNHRLVLVDDTDEASEEKEELASGDVGSTAKDTSDKGQDTLPASLGAASKAKHKKPATRTFKELSETSPPTVRNELDLRESHISDSVHSMPTTSTVTGSVHLRSDPPHANRLSTKNVPRLHTQQSATGKDVIFDDPAVVKSYDSIPLLELTKLPRGGVSMETQAVGRVQFGIPPETIKDSMRLGLGVPSVYIVPVERFCREMGPALGVNLAEFEFPAYFNFFVQRKRCTLIVDSDDAERNIRRVFSETLLGPAQFRREKDPMTHEAEDFSPDFPKEAIPNFQKELKHFRIMPDGKELVLETLLDFCHFNSPGESGAHEGLGIPPPIAEEKNGENLQATGGSEGIASIRSPSSRHTISEMPLSLSSPSLTKLGNAEDSKEHKKAEAKRLAEKKRQPLPAPSVDEELHRSASETNEMIKKMSKVIRNADHLASEIEPQNEQMDDEFEGGTDSKTWTYSQAKWIGDVSTVYPADATPEQIAKRATKRVEIFKMPGGTEYILHDIDENNHIVGKARFSGHVRVSESMGVDGFGGRSMISMDDTPEGIDEEGSVDLAELAEEEEAEGNKSSIPGSVLPPTFHPPSFGVTVLGNSHGFDKSGSVSGYVLWINGRGVMIDPPPYSSATLEREGIRPRTIVGIILTHCHADHDAGAFQKVLTGSPVVVITTPTIYKSFIRKYAALSALSPALLRHSHRHKPAIIGDPLRFQGATFHFTYTLHTIPCVGFRVEWRGRSMVFTGDHFNSPPAIDKLQSEGVLSKARADDLRNLPLQECDLLLHEAGAPPIHTPLDVLLKLPPKVKKRLYVVHTSALPDDCELRVAPTGTVGTIRLDQLHKTLPVPERKLLRRTSIKEDVPYQFEDDGLFPSPWNTNEYNHIIDDDEKSKQLMDSSFAHLAASPAGGRAKMPLSRMNSILGVQEPPLVSLRPTSSTDAWFILNLLSAVPFLSSLSYSSTMEVLETARVDAFCINDVVVPASRRSQLLCVVWEGTCMEREQSSKTSVNRRRPNDGVAKGRRISTFELTQGCHTPLTEKEAKSKKRVGAVWHAGDWTGPRSLQPEKRLSGESSFSKTHDIVAMSSEGVKVISVEFSNLHAILKSGSPLYRKYLARKAQQHAVAESIPQSIELTGTRHLLDNAVRNLNVIELLDCNSALRKLSAVQKRHLESLAEGPVSFSPGQRLWRSGAAVDKAYIVVAGTVSFVPRRRNAGSVGLPRSSQDVQCLLDNPWGLVQDDDGDGPQPSLGETMRLDAMKAIQELGTRMKEEQPRSGHSSFSSAPQAEPPTDRVEKQPEFHPETNELAISASLTDTHDYARLSRGLQKRADQLSLGRKQQAARRGSSSTEASMDKSAQEDTLGSQSTIDFHDLVLDHHDEHLDTKSPDAADEAVEVDITGVRSLTGEKDSGVKDSVGFQEAKDKRASPAVRRRSSRDRFANKVLGRLYSRRAFTAGLVFSRGHFLGDVSKMVAGLLSSAYEREHSHYTVEDCDNSVKYGFGEKIDTTKPDSAAAPIGEQVIHEQEGNQLVVHSSTLAAGKDGCVVLVFPRHSLIPFLDEFPGLLLSLLGTQVVV